MSDSSTWPTRDSRPLLKVVRDDEPTLRAVRSEVVELQSHDLIDDRTIEATPPSGDDALDALIQTHEVIRDLDDLKETLLRCDDANASSVRAVIADALAAQLAASTDALSHDGAPTRPTRHALTLPPRAETEREASLARDVRRLRQAVVVLSMMLVVALAAVATTAVAWTTAQDSAAAISR